MSDVDRSVGRIADGFLVLFGVAFALVMSGAFVGAALALLGVDIHLPELGYEMHLALFVTITVWSAVLLVTITYVTGFVIESRSDYE